MSVLRERRDFYGWRIVAAAFVLAVFGWGLGFYGPPVYLEAVRQARGWPVALVFGSSSLILCPCTVVSQINTRSISHPLAMIRDAESFEPAIMTMKP